MAHAYFIAGDITESTARAVSHSELLLESSAENNPNISVLRHGLLSVDDARKLRALAELSPTSGDKKVLIISASRLFHEAQNSLLKLFEEPPAGTILILVIPSEGMLLPTLRSRLQSLPGAKIHEVSEEIRAFLSASGAEREKLVSKLLDRTKSDKDEDKQAARLQALHLMEGLTSVAYSAWHTEQKPAAKHNLQLFLDDLQHFTPMLHERSAPLKLIFEHVLLTLPPLPKTA